MEYSQIEEALNKRGRDSKTFAMTVAALAATAAVGAIFAWAGVRIAELYAASHLPVDWVGMSVPLGAVLTALGGVPAWYVQRTKAHETAVRTAAINAGTIRGAQAGGGAAPPAAGGTS